MSDNRNSSSSSERLDAYGEAMKVFLESSVESISRGSNDDTYSKPKKAKSGPAFLESKLKLKTPSPNNKKALAKTLV